MYTTEKTIQLDRVRNAFIDKTEKIIENEESVNVWFSETELIDIYYAYEATLEVSDEELEQFKNYFEKFEFEGKTYLVETEYFSFLNQ